MKILVLGAGAIGGCSAAGSCRPAPTSPSSSASGARSNCARTAWSCAARTATSPCRRAPSCVPSPGAAVDLVLLTCKAYDLESAIGAIAPAVGASTCVLPLLNSVAHIERLAAAFGAARVAGGSCAIPATLTEQGEVVQLGTFHSIVFGRLPGTSADAQPKLEALRALYAATPVPVELSDDMMTALWEKFVGLATLAAMTCLMRACGRRHPAHRRRPGPHGRGVEACRRTAEAAGCPSREAALDRFRAMLGDRRSTLTASMLRDLEASGRTEGAHIVGDMLRRAQAAGIDPGPLRAAWCHLQAAERIRERKAAQ